MKSYDKEEKDGVGIIIAKMGKPKKSEETSEEDDLGVSCAEDLLEAIEKKDAKMVLEAFKTLLQACE